jgi:ubiquinone/menaquinone biosynthesis C-methylase UbiE
MEKVNANLKENYDSHYSESANEWREIGAKTKADNILQIVAGKKFTSLLEVGAGEGSILRKLSEKHMAEKFYALEISKNGVERIKEKNIKNLVEANLFDGYKIPYPDKFFDLVILSHVLEHVEFERSLLREIARVSKEQIIEVPRDFRFGADKKISHFLSYGHINMYTPTSFRFLLRTEGFEIKKEELRLYSYETFLFNAKNTIGMLKQILLYVFKKVLLNLPFRSVKELYCSTITVYVFRKSIVTKNNY